LRSQLVHHPLPSSIVSPLGEVVVNRALGRQIVRQHVPLAAAAVEVEDRIPNHSIAEKEK
jgi:hypothetical protein